MVVRLFEEFVNKFLGQAPLMLGFVVFIGYLLLKKEWYVALSGFIKTFVGFKILQVGTGGLVATFKPIIEKLSAQYNLSAKVIDPYFGQASGEKILDAVGSLTNVGYVMLIAFAWNILLVAFRKHTKIRTLFITGHIMYQQSVVLLWAMYWVIEGTTGQPVSMTLTVITGFLLGTYWSVMSNLIIEPTQEVTDGGGFTIGHQQMMGAWFAYRLGKYVGNKKHSVDRTEAPGFFSIFNDNVVANALIMTAFVGTIMVILGKSAFTGVDAQGVQYGYNQSKYWFGTYIWETTAYFAVYITIVLTGVRMFVAELTTSFQGISDRLLKGSVPAVDCAVTFGFSPQGPTYGFIFGFVGQLIAILSLAFVIKSEVLIIAGFICLFFDNGTLAIYANKSGGRRAAIIIPIVSGLIQVFGSALVLSFLLPKEGPMSSLVIGWMGMFDWATLWAGTTILSKWVGLAIPIILIPLMLVIPQLQYKRHKNTYFTTMRDE